MAASHAIFAACILQEVKDELGDARPSKAVESSRWEADGKPMENRKKADEKEI